MVLLEYFRCMPEPSYLGKSRLAKQYKKAYEICYQDWKNQGPQPSLKHLKLAKYPLVYPGSACR